MKEAFWGVLIIVLGLFGIVIVNLFQNVTVDNDRVYYVIKESTEAAAFDAIDLAHYRLNGTIRIVEDKFVENLTRRFAENISKGTYKIVVEDINEMPPKISLRVETGVSPLISGMNGMENPFDIVNRVDAIIETKYTAKDLEFVGITKDEWIERPEEVITGDVCTPTIGSDKDNCLEGDVKFKGHEDTNMYPKICIGETPPSNVSKKVNYQVCECGKWVDYEETLVASPRKNGREWIYEWKFYKEGNNRVINQVIKEKVIELQCTTGIQIMVPNDINEKNQDSINLDGNKISLPYQPSSESYEVCPSEGVKIPIGMSFVARPNYIPADSVNRELIWESSDSGVISVTGVNPNRYCELNENNTNCVSIGKVYTTTKVGTAYLNVETTEVNRDSEGNLIRRGQKATCKVEVFDGTIDSLSCKDMELKIGDSGVIEYEYSPKNATKVDLSFSVDKTKLASISGTKITAKEGGPVVITIKENNTGKTATCNLKIPSPTSSGGSSGGGGSSSSSGDWYYSITNSDGSKEYFGTKDAAIKAAEKKSKENGYTSVTVDYNAGKGNGENPVETVKVKKPSSGSSGYNVPKPKPDNGGTGSSKPSVGGGCFPEETMVLTINGYKKISQIKVGDMVLSYNENKKISEYKKVLTVYKHTNISDFLYSIVVNNKILKVTRLHTIYVKTSDGYDYVKVENLKKGDLLIDSENNYYKIHNISRKSVVADYYNIEVEDNHNYYVTRDNILVHNASSMH